ncbi:NADP-dependent 3-hydroxy acid dehydrogenase YdfG [Pedobacter westerhofensis]|uniref:NADP-dependent 3-hydroxy acid dehydrogenase YdfG n=1 Tax=Pedobacter westerhofensis TaxID=425512 RepID=A0A521BB45_9SPHI|nr:SDR family oxidoreductase [Pedobacter westerhofensis]SMO44211.1 NADP-dependent 3-hydroxy acid dehydrogenase YdfG [Pedobacter westerhofensis]
MKTWFITGTSTGLGRILTEKLLEQGHRVAATLRKPEAISDLKDKYGDRLWIARLDVTDTQQIKAVVKQAFEELKQIDVVVNNAGYALFCAAEEASDEQIRQQIDTNILGSVQVIRAALPYLRAQGSGRILQFSSAGGQTTYPNFSYYHLTKWAVEGFCDTLVKEITPLNIGLTIIEPGAHHTSFAAALHTAPVMEAYDATPAGDVRRAVASGGFPIKGDVNHTVQAVINSVEVYPAPLRLALGGDAYRDVRASLVSRLESLDNQKELALASELKD